MSLTLVEARRLLHDFAEKQAADFSPLYRHLALQSGTDGQVADFLTGELAVDSQDAPGLLMAAAHRLVQAEPLHPLSRYYPSLGGFDGVDTETWPLFRKFVLERAEKMRALLSARRIGDNDVRPAASLYPGVSLAAQAAGGEISLLEIGCGAGLLLGLDQFGYRYQRAGSEQLVTGPAKAAVGLHCALDFAPGARAPKLPKKLRVGARLGIDESPIDVSDEEQLSWLEACVWADQPDQLRLLRAAANAQRKTAPELIKGDLVADLVEVAARVPLGAPLVLLTNQLLTHWPRSRQEEFVNQAERLASQRSKRGDSLWWVSLESLEQGFPHLIPGRDSAFDSRRIDVFGDERNPSTNGVDPALLLALTQWTGGVSHTQALAAATARRQRMTWLA